MILKDYQEKYTAKLLDCAVALLGEAGAKTLTFKAPTGSGKTIMMAEFLARLSKKTGTLPLSFIWVAPKDLHHQSYKKLEQYYKDTRYLECLYFEYLTNNEIGENEILFFNWESIRQEDKNIYVRENEYNRYLGAVLENTKDAGREVILLIDESHYHAKSENSQQLIQDIAPKLTIEISATPNIDSDEKVRVPLDEVKQEGMVKASVVINDKVADSKWNGKIVTFSESSNKVLLERALEKRKELVAAYKKIKVNPLLCIQLPDDKSEQDGEVRTRAEKVLRENDITVENGKLAIRLSEENENHENIEIVDSEVEVLIFKQAIALGWDCPRAQILVLFRNWSSLVFSVQTLGRIMRMPEQHYYENDILNKAYVYTNVPKAEIHEDMAGGYVHIYTANRIKKYNQLKLKSITRIRQREQTRLSPRFIAIFLEEAKKYRLKERIKLQRQSVQRNFIDDYEVINMDESVGKTIVGKMRVNLENPEDLQRIFDYFAHKNLEPFYPEQRSVNRVKESIYAFFSEAVNMSATQASKIITIVLSEANATHFITVIDRTKEKYLKETEKRKAPLQITDPWEIQEAATYGEDHIKKESIEKSVIMPFYAEPRQSNPEKEFIDYLETATKVNWWYKNGAGVSLYFAVPYTENGEEHPFYVDFIVYFKNGTIGLYDTKEGITLTIAGNKSDGLLKYIQEENKDRKKKKLPLLTGGIIAKPKTGGWKIYTGTGVDIGEPSGPNWKPLDFN